MARQRRMPYLIGFLALIVVGMGWIGYTSVARVAGLTEELYEHPVAVWTAVLRIDANIVAMHRSMKDVALSASDAEIAKHMVLVDEAEVKAISDFALVRDRFEGDSALVQDALQSFLAWRPIRDEVIQLSLDGRMREAALITQASGLRQTEEIDGKIALLRDFAQRRAQTFLIDARDTRTNTLWVVILGLGAALILTGFIARRAVKIESDLHSMNAGLEFQVRERTEALFAANENLSAQNEEITAMNEELTAQNEEIVAQNTEIESLNQILATTNEGLEHQVAERTAEIKAANQELTVQYEEIRESQHNLQQERAMTDALFDSVPGMLYLYDDLGNLVRWNKQHEIMTGYSASELSHMMLLDWYKGDEETCAMITNEVARAFEKGFASAEADLRKKDGETIPMYLTAVPVKMDGRTYFAGIGIDITERRRLTRTLADQETRLRTLINTIPDLVWVKDAEGVYLSCNQMFERFFGANEMAIVGKTDYDFVDKDLADFFRENDRKSMMAGGPCVNEEWLNFSDGGQRVLVETVKVPMLDSDGAFIGILGISRDITDRKRMEEELEESESRYRAVMEQAPEAVVIFNPDTGDIIKANTRFTERFGYDLLKDNPLQVFHITADTPENIRSFLDQVKNDRFLPLQRRVLRHRNGTLIQVERSATLIQYRDCSLVVLTIRDVSDEIRREQEIHRDAQLATRVQNALLTMPKPTEYLELKTVYRPYSYVGGDLYFMDWRYNGQVLRGFIADATGHGLGTALHTASMHVLLREVNELDLPLAEQMKWLNRRAGQYFDEGTFAGALGFELDLQTRQLQWVCAGIPEIWIATKNYQGVVAKPGMYLGVSAEETFDVHTVQVDVGDSYYFLTDGLSELLVCRSEAPIARYPEMVQFLKSLAEDEACRDDATAICIHVLSLPQQLVPQNGWPRILRFNGYGDYQRFKDVIAKILAEVTGLPHSIQEVAVNEAIANALECRDGVPRQHRARVRFSRIGNWLNVRVKTSRMGFAGNAILRRLRSNQEELFSFGEDAGMGRGIPIMLSTTHRMAYNSEGTEVLLSWNLELMNANG